MRSADKLPSFTIMGTTLLQKYYYFILAAQGVLSLLNSLFTLSDQNLAIAILGFYGGLRQNKLALLGVCIWSTCIDTDRQYILLCAVSTVMDIARILVWLNYIQSKMLPYYNILG